MIRSSIGRGVHRGRHLAASVLAARAPMRTDLPLATWDLAVGSNGRLARRGVDLADLVATHGSPLHVVDADALGAVARGAVAAGAAAEPAVGIYFSYKTNPVPAVLRTLHDHGVGAEVISPYELWLARRLGMPGDRIIYNGPAKSVESLREAIGAGVRLINANAAGDARRIMQVAADTATRASLGIRISLPSMWGGQFGVAAGSGTVAELVDAARRHEHVDLRGLHFHRGHTARTVDEYAAYVQEILEYLDRLRDETSWHPEVLDLGGSLACPTSAPFGNRSYRMNRALATDLLPPDPATCLSVAGAAALASQLVGAHFAARGLQPPELALEPGRALSSSSQLLLTTVLDVKLDGALPHAILDAGMNIAEPVHGEYHQLLSVSAPRAPHERSYRLAGPICTPADVLYNNWRLPELEPGHVLAIMDTGAYFVPFSTSFSFPRPAIALQRGAAVVLARSAERFDDVVGRDLVGFD